jgi:hypothetical protein
MKGIKKNIIPTLALLLFIIIMNSGVFLKRSFNSKDNVLEYIERIKFDVKDDKWIEAQDDFHNLQKAWDLVEKRVQFSVERNEMNLIDFNLARMGGAFSVHDKSFIIIELNELMEHWRELEK